MGDVYLAVEELISITEFDFVATKDPITLAHYVTRAHILALDYGPFPTFDALSGDAEVLAEFKSQMKVALFLVAESMVLANPARPMASAGITQERAAQLNLSRAEGGGRSGKTKAANSVPPEAEGIFRRYAQGTLELLKAQRTDVFEPTRTYDINDPNRKLVAREDIDNLSIEIYPRPGGAGGQLFDADQ